MNQVVTSVIIFILKATLTAADSITTNKCQEYAKLVYQTIDSPILLRTAVSTNVSECGAVSVPLIVGGEKASKMEFPHMAEIGFGDSPDGNLQWACGGSLISEKYVLSAAHCVEARGVGPAQKARFGSVDFSASTENAQEIAIAKRIPHPDYRSPIKYNDIALFELANEVEFNSYVRPACLHNQDEIKDKKAVAIGFGKLEYDEQVGSKHLMKVALTILPKANCEKAYGDSKSRLPKGIIDSMLCVGEMAGGKDTCQGDSGGPLHVMLEDPYCMYNVLGVTSFGKFCGFSGSPGIYTKVSKYIDWIEGIVWPNGK